MAEFEAVLRGWADKVKGQESLFLRKFTQEFAFKIVTLTPVDTGWARASWWSSIGTVGGNPNQPNHENFGESGSHVDMDQGRSFAMMALVIDKVKIGDIIYLANNAEYIEKLEYGSSQQAPNGMIRLTLADADNIAQSVISRIVR